ncbi:MAG TPA: dihydropteroate synthase [Solirubrobacteraceae bacterium]|nr:dihydropteroate synthase [Solirubrobacteraceae bacterium]
MAPRRTLRAGSRTYELGERPWLMAVVNANPDSFSGPGGDVEGADVVDVGGESAITGRPPVEVDEEIARVVPVVERLAGAGRLVSVDTYKPAVAEAAIAAGASIVNDVSGLRDPALADVCARTGAALVLMHTRAAPKQRLQDPAAYDDVVADVARFLRERMAAAVDRGVAEEQLLLDPGPDFAKTPAQTIAVLQRLDALHELGRPLLLAISRKDFIGALTGRRPADRGAGTLAALAHGADAGGHVFRVHDVAAARDFLAVRAALRGEREVPPNLTLADELRHDPPVG